jgi:hypothetical protein
MPVIIASIVIAVLSLAACEEPAVKHNIECKTYVGEASCSADSRCVWHDKEDGTYRCKKAE